MTGSPHPKRSKWGRRAAALVVFLALGFVVNVGIAWTSIAGLRDGWLRSVNTSPQVRLGNAIVGGRFVVLNSASTLLVSRVNVQSQPARPGFDPERSRQASRIASAAQGTPEIVDATTLMPA